LARSISLTGKGQVEGDGFTRQEKAIREYATAHGIRIVRKFKEEGVSGTKETMDRQAWRELMAALHSDGVRTIVIEKLDRLARDLMVQESVIADLRKYGFELISVHEPDLMASDPTRVLLRQMLGALAQYDKSQIVVRLRGARLRKRSQTGRCEGRKPFGYYEGEAEVVARMRGLREGGLSFHRIAAKLNEEGITPRSGARWHGFAVLKILSRLGESVSE
jgi:DNA invertase Pin-like site-specific DNA recombinase